MIKSINGFSLIELMVVIAIVALLSAIAIPAYKNYIVKSKVASSLNVFDSLKAQSLTYYASNGNWPTAENLGFASPDGTTLSNPETDLGAIIAPLSSGGTYISSVSITSPCVTTYQEIRLVIEADGPGPFVRGAVMGFFRMGSDSNGVIIQQCSDDENSSGEENVYFNNCQYNSQAAFEAAICA